MKKIYMVLVIFLALGLTISAVSAVEWSWSSASSTDGAYISVNNNEVKIQGFSFTLPEGYTERTDKQVAGDNATGFDGCKVSSVTFEKDNSVIVIDVIYGQNITEDGYTPSENATAKEIANQKGYLTDHGDYLSFAYIKNGKFVQIDAPNEDNIAAVVKSAK